MTTIPLSSGFERQEFAGCPKDSTLPKCPHCASLIRHGDCPLGREAPKITMGNGFNGKSMYAFSESEDLSATQAGLETGDLSGHFTKDIGQPSKTINLNK